MNPNSIIKALTCTVVCFASILLRTEICHANYSGPMRFFVYRPCAGSSFACAPRILAEGTIEDNTAEKFSKFLMGKDKPPFNLPSKAILCFDSPGGSLVGAVNLGHKIRDVGFDTCVESDYRRMRINPQNQGEEIFLKDAVCASSCVIAMAGGIHRRISEQARIGVHQFTSALASTPDSTIQLRDKAVAGYLELMGVHRTLLIIASLHPPNTMRWLSTKEIRQLRLDNQSR